jgi:hypothetical protein
MRWEDPHDGAIYVDGSVWEPYRASLRRARALRPFLSFHRWPPS